MTTGAVNELTKLIDEKSKALGKILEEAGPELDPAKVSVVSLRDGAELRQQIEARTSELKELMERLELVEGAEKARKRAEAVLDEVPGQQGRAAQARPQGPLTIPQVLERNEKYRAWAMDRTGAVSLTIEDVYFSELKGAKAFTTGSWDPLEQRLSGYVPAPQAPTLLLDVTPMGRATTDTVTYVQETTVTQAAREVAEGALYPESTYATTIQTVPVRKVSHIVEVTDEALADVAQAETYLNNRLIEGLRMRLDRQILIGDGVAPNLRGIANTTGILTQARGTDSHLDALFKAITRVRTEGWAEPTHILMHPTDWQTIRLQKTTDGVYILGSPAERGQQTVWGLPVLVNAIDAQGSAYVLSMSLNYITLFERQGMEVQIGYTGTQFAQGMRTIRGDARFALAVFRPSAFCKVTGL